MEKFATYIIGFTLVSTMMMAAGLQAVMPKGIRANFDRLYQLAEERYGSSGRQAMQEWHELLANLGSRTRTAQLERINEFINLRLYYTEDSVAWKQLDYWATPLEALGRGVGDCEDSAFAKYISLLQLGIPDEQLRLVYVRARLRNQDRAHMVLSYYDEPDQEPLILDSLVEEILPASRRPDLFPVFSFNAAALWVGSKTAPATTTPTANLSNWRSVLERMREEGWK